MNLLSIFTALTLAANTGFNFEINLEGFLQTLPMMLYGMLGIFMVIIAIMIGIKVLFMLFPVDKEKKKKDKDKKE